jgi:hypothetical protein
MSLDKDCVDKRIYETIHECIVALNNKNKELETKVDMLTSKVNNINNFLSDFNIPDNICICLIM